LHLINSSAIIASNKFNAVEILTVRGATGSRGSIDPHFFEYAVHMLRLTPTFCQLFRLRPPLFVTLRGNEKWGSKSESCAQPVRWFDRTHCRKRSATACRNCRADTITAM